MAIKNKKGFTLVEFLVSLLLTSIVMLAVYSVYRVQTHSVKIQEGNQEAQEYARAVVDMMVREIRNIGYLPAGACATIPVNTTGIVAAADQSFQFVYDANGDTDCADLDENITYAFDTTGCASGFGNITRKEGTNTAQALTDCNVPTGTGNFSFVYYPQQTSGSAPSPYCYPSTSLPSGCVGDVSANLANIQRVSINVTVQSKWADTQFGGQIVATVNSNTDLRNRGLPS